MKAVILAAGEGKRMRPLTLERPKQLLWAGDKPLIHHLWDVLPEEISEAVVVVGYKGEMIKQYLGDKFQGKHVRYVTQKEKTGPADALKLTRPYLPESERFLVMYADDLHHGPSIRKMLRHSLSLLAYEVNDPRRFGVVMTDAEGKITGIEEKPENPKSNLAAVGVYLLDSRIFNYEADPGPGGEFFLTSMIEKMIRDHAMYVERTSFWLPMGYPEDLRVAEELHRTGLLKRAIAY